MSLLFASVSAAICTTVVSIARYSPHNACESKWVFLFYLQLLSETCLISGRIQRDISKKKKYLDLHVKCLTFTFLTILEEVWTEVSNTKFEEVWTEVSNTKFEEVWTEVSNTKFLENYSSWRRVISCERTDGRTDRMTKLTAALPIFAKAPKNYLLQCYTMRGGLPPSICPHVFHRGGNFALRKTGEAWALVGL